MSITSKQRRDAKKKRKPVRNSELKPDWMVPKNFGACPDKSAQKDALPEAERHNVVVVVGNEMEFISYRVAEGLQRGEGRIRIETKKGYKRAFDIAAHISNACADLGVNLPPCEIPIAVQPVNRKGVFFTWMPHSRPSAEECCEAPVIIIVKNCFRYDGVNDEGGHMLTKIDGDDLWS